MDSFDSNVDEKGSGDVTAKNYNFFQEGDLKALKFFPNTLYSFPIKKFLNFFEITHLSMPNNHLKTLDEDLFYHFPHLTWLDVRDNRIQSFPRVINHKSLEQILLGGNKIEKLPIELGSFENLYGLQVAGNPLTFPDLKYLESTNYNLVEFLKLCWKHQSMNPLVKIKPEIKAKKKLPLVKKEECIAPVQQFKNVANVVAEKIKSSDPIDQLMASNVLKKLRAIDMDLKKVNDKNALKEWRERYSTRNFSLNKSRSAAPFGVDTEFMTMMTRQDLNQLGGMSNRLKKKFPKQRKKAMNINEELKKLDMELENLKSRKTSLDPAAEKVQRMMDIQMMNSIQKKIKELHIENSKNS